MNRMTIVISRSKEFSRKYFVPFSFWLAGIIGSALLATLITDFNSTTFIRGFGMWLQISGVSLVIYGIAQSRRFFGKPGFWRSIYLFFDDLVQIFRKPKVINVTANAHVGGVTASATAGVIRAQPTIEERLTELEHLTKELRATMNSRLNELSEALERNISAERAARHEGDEKIRNQVEVVGIGSARIQLGGALYIMLGVVLTSIPDELIRHQSLYRSLTFQ